MNDVLKRLFYIYSKVVIFQPPRLQVKLEPSANVYSGSASSSAIKSFVEGEIHGIVGHRTQSNAEEFKKPLVVVYYGVDYVKDVKGSNYVRNRIIKVAQKLRDESVNVRFAVSNSDEFRNELTELGIDDVKSDAKYIAGRGARGEKYKSTGEYR